MHTMTGTKITRLVLAAFSITVSVATVSRAQESPPQTQRLEIRVTGGELVPTGDQRSAIDNAKMTAAQVSWLVRPQLAVTGTFGWARSRDVASVDRPKLNIFTSDLGLEVRPRQWFHGRAVTFDAFAGAGVGARSYDYRNVDARATHNLAGYGAAGGELGVGRVGVRVEVRDYVSGFKPLTGNGPSHTRNDMVITAAVRINRNASR
jgi:hypothetical protein